MLSSLLLLVLTGAALAKDGFVKLDFEREYVKEVMKRQVTASELDENVTLAQQRSVCRTVSPFYESLIANFSLAVLVGLDHWNTTTTIPSAT